MSSNKMRILLDSRDLINLLEHGRPVGVQKFEAYLRAADHQVVLTFTNVRELAGPLARGAEFMRLRPTLQSLDGLPHVCLKEATIVAIEIQRGVDAFNRGTEYEGCSPYVPRWDYILMALPGGQQSATENWLNFPLDEMIYYINRTRPDVFAPPADHHLERLQMQLQKDRELLRAGQAPARQHFIRSVKNHAATNRISLPKGREDEFAEWVYARADRCPGLRLNHEMYRTLMANYTDIPEAADFSDLAHVFAIPYVDAVTLDNRMRHYCTIASRKMMKFGAAYNHAGRLYEDVVALIQRNPV